MEKNYNALLERLESRAEYHKKRAEDMERWKDLNAWESEQIDIEKAFYKELEMIVKAERRRAK